jgi:hypothetical protein
MSTRRTRIIRWTAACGSLLALLPMQMLAADMRASAGAAEQVAPEHAVRSDALEHSGTSSSFESPPPAHADVPVASESPATGGLEASVPAEAAPSAESGAADLIELPIAPTDTAVIEYSGAPEPAAPLIEVAAPAASSELVREAAPPSPNADGKYLAADLLGAAMLSGPGFTIAPEVEVRGYMFQYTLQTPFGDIAAESNELLPIRIDEVSAIERLEDTGMTEAAGKQAKKKSRQVWEGLKRVFTKPKETVAGLPQGVARMVKTRVVKLGRQASKLYDRSKDELAEDPNAPKPTGPFTATRTPDAPSDESRASKEGKKLGKQILKDELDYSSTRRFIAHEVGVDPYSSNPVLRQKLDALAWSATSSNAAYKLAMGALSTATAGTLPYLLKIDKAVWELEPENLANTNRLRLNELGCSPELTRRVVRNGAFSPTLQTELVGALAWLAPTRGCDEVLDMAIDAEGEVEGRFMVNSLRLLMAAPLPGRVGFAPGECEIETLGGGLAARCNNELLVPVPVDALIWDQDMAEFLNAEHVRSADARTILLSGFADLEARTRLTERGFAIIERAPLN